MYFRTYTPADKDQLITILESNCPKYFRIEDKDDLIYFLDNFADDNYLVAVEGGTIIGCGGHYTKADCHGIAWVMFKYGALGSSRLFEVADAFYAEIESRLLSEKTGLDIVINTTQLMQKFFSRYGFHTTSVVKDGFGEGLDECCMVKPTKEL
ncbi:hypothetical protein JCM19236_908 [Vibrio sp. JCM 19236]|nr:hypothetical protein JCM19236_908 [Vibrio sp. JCM 19236]